MTDKDTGRPPERIRDKLRFSIVFKLNTRFAAHLLSAFLALDMLVCIAAGAMLFLSAERILQAAVLSAGEGAPVTEGGWLEAMGCHVAKLEREPQGFQIPARLRDAFPEQTAGAYRSFSLPGPVGFSFWERIDRLSYCLEWRQDADTYLASVALGRSVRQVRYFLLVLLIVELLMLIQSAVKGERAIRKTLLPISELAQAAQTLNAQGNRAFTPEEMRKLAGKLDDINAAKLDTRISVEGTQDELKTLAAAINGMLDRINDSYRLQVRFVSDASHELRTPISVIQGYANLLDRWGKNDEKTLQESIDAIKEEAANMKALVEQLLFLARGDNDSMVLHMEQFDLCALGGEVLGETRMIDGAHEYRSALAPVEVCADQALIKQALRILMDNAVKYTPAGGHISISVSQKDHCAWLTVQDDGIGIPPQDVPQIFERFYRADESRARKTGGTGLGLSIAKWIAERHGGHMEVLSREDIGTRISVVLPAVSPGAQAPPLPDKAGDSDNTV